MANRVLRDWTKSEKMESVSYQAEVLFTRLIMKADDFGSFYGNPKMIRPELFPLRVDKVREADISRWLHELQSAGLIALYEADSKAYLRILDFRQRLQNMRNRFPDMPTHGESQKVTVSHGESPPESETEEEVEKETEKKTPTIVGGKENAGKAGSTTKRGKVSVSEKSPSNSHPEENKKPPPSSAAPPSTIVRDEKGVATCQELRKLLLEYQSKNPEKYSIEMFKAFLRYWSEPNQKGKPRWKTEKEKKNGRFDIPGRLATWKELDDKNSKSNANRGGNQALGSRSLAEPNYRGESNVRKVEI